MTSCNTSHQKNFALIISRIMRWRSRGAWSMYGEKTNTYKLLVGKTEGKILEDLSVMGKGKVIPLKALCGPEGR